MCNSCQKKLKWTPSCIHLSGLWRIIKTFGWKGFVLRYCYATGSYKENVQITTAAGKFEWITTQRNWFSFTNGSVLMESLLIIYIMKHQCHKTDPRNLFRILRPHKPQDNKATLFQPIQIRNVTEISTDSRF